MSGNRAPLLVFAVAGQIGSGASFVAEKIRHTLYGFQYEVEVVDASTIIKLAWFFSEHGDQADLKKLSTQFESSFASAVDRTRKLQDLGNSLRKRFGNDIIARLAIRNVILPKLEEVGFDSRQAFVVDSLKRPEEVALLRAAFGGAFCAVGVTATNLKRSERLRERKGYSDDELKDLSQRDADEESEPCGQRSVDTVMSADYFLANEYPKKEDVGPEAERLVGLLFASSMYTPRHDEFAMNVAFKAAAKSACLSRRVGAAIFSKTKAMLATGCNDVPKFSGGLYSADSEEDRRCWALGGKCYNDDEKALIMKQLVDALIDDADLWNKDRADIRSKVETIVAGSRIKRLLEFSRAVHAEMDAIVAVARDAMPGLRGATLYCTTYPCHSCAKHIIASGIERVVYLEPYEKSLARKLHSDALVDTDKGQGRGGVKLDLYNGAAPSRYEEFFGTNHPRKEKGRYIDRGSFRQQLLPLGGLAARDLEERLKRIESSGEMEVLSTLPTRSDVPTSPIVDP